MKIGAFILARGGSKGIPGKNIINFIDKPLIAHTIDHAKNSKFIKNNIYVSSDDDMILEISKRYGASTIKRPDDLSTDESDSELALKHAIKSSEIDWDIIVFLQPTSPIRKIDDIDKAIEQFLEDEENDSLFSASPLNDDSCLWLNHSTSVGDTLIPTYDIDDRKRRQESKDNYYIENGSIYIFKPNILFEKNNRLGRDIDMYIMEKWQQYEIDEWDDLGVCEFMIRRYL